MADDNKPTADQIQFALDLAKEKGKDYTESKLKGMSGKEVSDAIDSMKKEETEATDKQVSFALDLLKEQGKSKPTKAQLDKMPGANISKLIDKLKDSGSSKTASQLTRRQVTNLMKKHRLPGAVGGRGTSWKIEVKNEAEKRKVEKVFKHLGGYMTGYGGWVLSPDYKSKGDWNDPSSRHHYASQIGRTILEQMGGRRLGMMLGVKKFLFGPKGLSFMWPNRQRTKGNYVSITLRGDDTYDMEFANVSRGGKKPVKTYKSLYAEDLIPTFERQTGWMTHMASQKQGANPFARQLDPDQERMFNDLLMRAENEGAYYAKKDATGAVKQSMRGYATDHTRDMRHDGKVVMPMVVKALEAQWKEADRQHRRNQRSASIKKAALDRAKTSPEFRKKLVAHLRTKA